MEKICCSMCFNPKRTSFLSFIDQNGFDMYGPCPYCGKAGGKKINVSVLGPFVDSGLKRAYEKVLPDAKSVRVYSLFEILTERVFLFERENPNVMQLVADLLESYDVHDRIYVMKLSYDFDETLQYRIWKNFEHDCKYFNRFFDLTPETHKRGDMLNQLYESCLKNLEEVIPAGSEFCRARVIDSRMKRGLEYDLDEASIGPATLSNSMAGRMNPEGISYFYVAEDEETALKEGRLRANERVLIGRFKTLKDLTVIDWTKSNIYEKAVDIFSPKYSPSMAVYQDFLRQFAIEVGKPNENGKPIEYVATQLVAEYVRGYNFDGIKYDSTVGKGFDLVFFYGPRHAETNPDYNYLPEYTDIASLVDVSEFKIKIEYVLEP